MKINITKWKELPTGEVDMSYTFDDEFKQCYLKSTGAKKFTQKGMNEWILGALEESCENELTRLEKRVKLKEKNKV